jgi:hypothetical protein
VGCLGLATVVCVVLVWLGSVLVSSFSGSSWFGGSGGYYPEELASKHEALYLVPGLYDFSSAQQFAVGVDQGGKKATVYWRYATTFTEFDSKALESLIGTDTFDGHNRDFSVKYELNANVLSGEWSWWHVFSKTDGYRGGWSEKDQIFQHGSFRWELTAQNRFKPAPSQPGRRTKAQFKDQYEDLAGMLADFDALYEVKPSEVPSPGLKKLVVGVFGRKPEAVLFGQWDTHFERLTDRNCCGLPREDVMSSSVSYELKFAEIKGKLGVTRRVEGFQPKKTDSSFEFKLKDRDRYKAN